MYVGAVTMEVLKQLKVELTYEPVIPFQGICLEEILIWKDTCTPIFVAALFTIGKAKKQCKCLEIRMDRVSSSSDGKASACQAGDPGSIPESGRSPGEGNGNPLQYSCLENSMNRRVWRATSPWGGKVLDMTEQLTHTYMWKKMWYKYAMKCYWVIEKNEIMPFAATWMGLEIFILSEVNQTEEKYRMPSLMWGI